MKGASTMLLAAVALALTAGAQAQSYIWHEFFYELKDGVDATKIYPILKQLVDSAPAAGKPISYSFGPDAGVSKQLYGKVAGATVVPVQTGFGGYLTFKDVANIKAFFTYLLPLPAFIKLNADYVKAADRQQLAFDGKMPPKGTKFWAHAFSYRFPNAATNAKLSVETWKKWIAAAPVKPIFYVWGGDLGLGKQLYPASKVANWDFSATLSFKSKADLVAFWKWLFAQKAYSDWVVKGPVTAAVRMQYSGSY